MTSVWISPDMVLLRSGAGASAAVLPDPPADPMGRILLRRSGGRPIGFEGMLMIEHAGHAASGERAHSIRLYETSACAIVIEVALSGADDEGPPPHIVVEEVGSMAEAEAFLRSYDPAAQAALMALDHGPSGLAAQAVRLEREAMRLRADYQAAQEAVFAAFDAAEDDTMISGTRTN